MNAPTTPPNGEPIWIETNSYLLRSLTPQDVTMDLFNWVNTPEMLHDLQLDSPGMDLAGFQKMVAALDNLTRFCIAIYQPDDSGDQPLGLYTIKINLKHKVAHLLAGTTLSGNKSREIFWSTCDALLDRFFDAYNVEKVSTRVLANNYKLFLVFNSTPRFTLEAILKSECQTPDGQRADLLLCAACRGGGSIRLVRRPKAADSTAP
ncbi:MAG: hypothetical protein LBG66_03005 [Gallionellaceae bacterium]|nr:hypothetical protein [Gallionellaceae bacterium]